MKKSRFTDEQIIGFLKQAEGGMPVKELCRLGGFSDATFYKWCAKFGGMQAGEATRLREIESQDGSGTVRACRYARLSRTSYREPPSMNKSTASLSTRIVELAHERRRFGYRRIHDLLSLEGHQVNHKRVRRLYKLANLSVRKRRKVKRPTGERQPLAASQHVNDTWSADFVMDALANGRRIKCLTVVDDFSRECVDMRWTTAWVASTSCACWTRQRSSAATRWPSARIRGQSSPVGPSWRGQRHAAFGTCSTMTDAPPRMPTWSASTASSGTSACTGSGSRRWRRPVRR